MFGVPGGGHTVTMIVRARSVLAVQNLEQSADFEEGRGDQVVATVSV